MKTQNTKLRFNKSSILELQTTELLAINGGSTIAGGETCSGCVCNTTLTITKDKTIQLPTVIGDHF